jgi:hypothetical protein
MWKCNDYSFYVFAELRQVVKKTKNMLNIKWSESWINIQ